MEITTLNSTHDELAEAVRGIWGKDILKDCKFVYCGNIVFGFGNNTEVLDKNVKCSHYEWSKINDNLYCAIIR